MAKLSLDKIKEELTDIGMEYISGKYENLKSILTIKCAEDHEFLSSLFCLRKEPTCPICFQYENIEKSELEIIQPIVKKGKRILVLDNATHKSGYAIFEAGKYLHGGIKQTDKPESAARIADIRQWFISMINIWEIEVVGLENVQYQGNAQTLIILSKLLGVLENAVYETIHKEPYIISAATWKSFCKIKGKLRQQQKENAQEYVKQKLNITVSSDLADAICLGLYICEQEKFGEEISW